MPERLRTLLGRLVGCPAAQIVLGNSTSHGLHLIANGLGWQDGDEILVIEGDYPATVLPWQRLAHRGVRVRPLRPAGGTTLPWTASLELLLDTDIHAIAGWDQQLVSRLVNGLDHEQYQLISPPGGPSRSTLVVLSRKDGSTRQRHEQLAAAGIDTAYREGNLRLSPHLFNTADQADEALRVLNAPH